MAAVCRQGLLPSHRVGCNRGLRLRLGVEDAARVQDREGHLRPPLHPDGGHQHEALPLLARGLAPRVEHGQVGERVDVARRVEPLRVQRRHCRAHVEPRVDERFQDGECNFGFPVWRPGLCGEGSGAGAHHDSVSAVERRAQVGRRPLALELRTEDPDAVLARKIWPEAVRVARHRVHLELVSEAQGHELTHIT
eukprot:scaffold34200_cov112-Isochrysis_galbana.AAC.3